MDGQHVVESGVRALGCLILFALTLGRYCGPQKDGLLLEGAVGMGVVAAVSVALAWV